MTIRRQRFLLHKLNFPGKPRRARIRFPLQKKGLYSVLTLFPVYAVLRSLLEPFQARGFQMYFGNLSLEHLSARTLPFRIPMENWYSI